MFVSLFDHKSQNQWLKKNSTRSKAKALSRIITNSNIFKLTYCVQFINKWENICFWTVFSALILVYVKFNLFQWVNAVVASFR